MSNTHDIIASSSDLKELKNKYLELILRGYVEKDALEELNFPRHLYLKVLLEDLDFVSELNEARKLRADVWVAKIAKDIDKDYDKDEIPSQRLKFDKLQFLAKADNPEKYGTNSKKMDINIDLTQFRLLPPELAMQSLANDPFAPKTIQAEFIEVAEDEGKDEELL